MYEKCRTRICPNNMKITSPTELPKLVYITDIFLALRMNRKDSASWEKCQICQVISEALPT